MNNYFGQSARYTVQFQIQSELNYQETQDSNNMQQNPQLEKLLGICQIMHTSQNTEIALQEISKALPKNQKWTDYISDLLTKVFDDLFYGEKVSVLSHQHGGKQKQTKQKSKVKNIAIFILHLINGFLAGLKQQLITIKNCETFWGTVDYYLQDPNKNTQEELLQFLEENFPYCIRYIKQSNVKMLLQNPIKTYPNMRVRDLTDQLSKKGIGFVQRAKKQQKQVENKKVQEVVHYDGQQKIQDAAIPLLLINGQLLLTKLPLAQKYKSDKNQVEVLVMIKCPKFYDSLLQKAIFMVQGILKNQRNAIIDSYYAFFQQFENYQISKKKLVKIDFNIKEVKGFLLEGLKKITGVIVKLDRMYGWTQSQRITVNFAAIVWSLKQLDQANTDRSHKLLALTSLCITILHQITHYAIRQLGLVKQGCMSFQGQGQRMQNQDFSDIDDDVFGPQVTNKQSRTKKEKSQHNLGHKQDLNKIVKNSEMFQFNRLTNLDRIQFKLIQFVADNRKQFLEIRDLLKEKNNDFYLEAKQLVFNCEASKMFGFFTLQKLEQFQKQITSENNEKGLTSGDQSESESVKLTDFQRLVKLFLNYKQDDSLSCKFEGFKQKELLGLLYKYIEKESEMDLDKLIDRFQQAKVNSYVKLNQSEVFERLKQFNIVTATQIGEKVFGVNEQDPKCATVRKVLKIVFELGKQELGLSFSQNMSDKISSKLSQINKVYIQYNYLGHLIDICVESLESSSSLENFQRPQSGWIMQGRLFRTFGKTKTIYEGDYYILRQLAKSKNRFQCLDLRWRLGNNYLNKKPHYANTSIIVARAGMKQISIKMRGR